MDQPLAESTSNLPDFLGSYGNPESWAYSTLVLCGDEKLVQIYQIKESKYFINRERVRQRMWLHDILDDNAIPYQIEISSRWISRKKFRETQHIFVEEKYKKKARRLIKEYKKASIIVPEDMDEGNMVDNA